MKKDNILALTELSAIGALAGKELRWLEKNKGKHPEIRVREEETNELSALLAQTLPQRQAPQALRETLLNVLGADLSPEVQSHVIEEVGKEDEDKRPWKWEIIIGIIVLGVTFFLIYDLAKQHLDPAKLTKFFSRPKTIESHTITDYKDAILNMLYEPEARFASFKGLDPSPEAQGILVWNLHKRIGYLYTANLPSIDPSAHYKLWAFNERGPHFVSVIELNKNGESFTEIKSLPKGFMFKKFAISLEYHLHGNEKPGGKIYLIGDVNR